MESWTNADEDQYEAIKKSLLEQGKPEDRAEEIAARTVNKRRRKEGRTENETTTGTGNPHDQLEERSVEELRNRARELKVGGRSDMVKSELIEAIRKHQ